MLSQSSNDLPNMHTCPSAHTSHTHTCTLVCMHARTVVYVNKSINNLFLIKSSNSVVVVVVVVIVIIHECRKQRLKLRYCYVIVGNGEYRCGVHGNTCGVNQEVSTK